jgi:hypothetical protein
VSVWGGGSGMAEITRGTAGVGIVPLGGGGGVAGAGILGASVPAPEVISGMGGAAAMVDCPALIVGRGIVSSAGMLDMVGLGIAAATWPGSR